MPVSILMVVDFPAPLGPMNATDSPSAILRLTPSTAVTSERSRRNPCRRLRTKFFFRFSMSTPRCIIPPAVVAVDDRPKNIPERLTQISLFVSGFDRDSGAGEPLPHSQDCQR